MHSPGGVEISSLISRTQHLGSIRTERAWQVLLLRTIVLRYCFLFL